MSLPVIDSPTFEMNLYSLKDPIIYRPFLVKEEKLLLMAMEGGNDKEILRATKQILNNCIINEDFNIETLPLFDMQYALLKIRGKSIGETIDLRLKHPKEINKKKEICNAETPVKINLSNINLTVNEEHKKYVRLTDTISVEMRYPTIEIYERLSKIEQDESASGVNELFHIIMDCIHTIYSGDESFSTNDYERQDLENFVGSLTSEQFNKIKEFYNTMPALLHDIKWTCKTCECDEEVTLNGLGDFFL